MRLARRSSCIFQIFLGIGWLGIPFRYPTEVTTTRVRKQGRRADNILQLDGQSSPPLFRLFFL